MLKSMLFFSFAIQAITCFQSPFYTNSKIITKVCSHFSVVDTQIKDKEILIQSLLDIDNEYDLHYEPKEIKAYNGENIWVDLSIKQKNGHYIGFHLKNDAYTIVSDLQFWEQKVPVDVFLERITKQYSIHSIFEVAKSEGFVPQIVRKDDSSGTIEIELSRYTL